MMSSHQLGSVIIPAATASVADKRCSSCGKVKSLHEFSGGCDIRSRFVPSPPCLRRKVHVQCMPTKKAEALRAHGQQQKGSTPTTPGRKCSTPWHSHTSEHIIGSNPSAAALTGRTIVKKCRVRPSGGETPRRNGAAGEKTEFRF